MLVPRGTPLEKSTMFDRRQDLTVNQEDQLSSLNIKQATSSFQTAEN